MCYYIINHKFNKMKNAILEIRRYIKKFGNKKGLELYYKINRCRAEIISISLLDINFPFNLRKKTSDIPTFMQIFWNKEYDFNLNFTPEYIVDAGGNIGLAAIYFANKFPKTKIISIEPEKNNYNLLIENTKYYDNIIPLNRALSNINNQELIIVDNGYGNWGFMTEPINKSEPSSSSNRINSVSIEYIMKKYQIDYLDLLKIDIEGFEKELFESNTDWLNNVRCLVIELHDRMKPGCSISFFKAISKLDFSFSLKGENLIFMNNNKKNYTQQKI